MAARCFSSGRCRYDVSDATPAPDPRLCPGARHRHHRGQRATAEAFRSRRCLRTAPISEGRHFAPRSAALALLNARVRAALPPGALAPPDLAAAAISRLGLARAVLGDVVFERVHHAPPVTAL